MPAKNRLCVLAALVAISFAGCGKESDDTDKSGLQEIDRQDSLTPEQILFRCRDFCFRTITCFWEICNEDYPHSFSTGAASANISECLADYCDTNKFELLLKKDPAYIRCNAELDCRSIAVGICDESLRDFHCHHNDPNSKPHLPPTDSASAH